MWIERFAAVLVLVLIILLIVVGESRRNYHENSERLELNQSQVLDDKFTYKKLYLTFNEFNKIKDKKILELIDSLKVKPKRITKFIERYHTSTDTLVINHLLVDSVRKGIYPFIDMS